MPSTCSCYTLFLVLILSTIHALFHVRRLRRDVQSETTLQSEHVSNSKYTLPSMSGLNHYVLIGLMYEGECGLVFMNALIDTSSNMHVTDIL